MIERCETKETDEIHPVTAASAHSINQNITNPP